MIERQRVVADDKANTEIRYKIEQVTAQDASALAVSVEQMRRDGVDLHTKSNR